MTGTGATDKEPHSRQQPLRVIIEIRIDRSARKRKTERERATEDVASRRKKYGERCGALWLVLLLYARGRELVCTG